MFNIGDLNVLPFWRYSFTGSSGEFIAPDVSFFRSFVSSSRISTIAFTNALTFVWELLAGIGIHEKGLSIARTFSCFGSLFVRYCLGCSLVVEHSSIIYHLFGHMPIDFHKALLQCIYSQLMRSVELCGIFTPFISPIKNCQHQFYSSFSIFIKLCDNLCSNILHCFCFLASLEDSWSHHGHIFRRFFNDDESPYF